MTISTDYFKNFLSILNLRFYTLLAACPADNRVEARDFMTRIADPSLEPDLEFSDAEVSATAELLDALNSENDKILAEGGKIGDIPSIEVLRERFGLSGNEMILLTAILAPAVDERFRRLYTLFQYSEEPRVDFLLGLLDNDGLGRYAHAELLGKEGTLFSHSLIELVNRGGTSESAAVCRPAPGLLSWLNGIPAVDYYLGRAEWSMPDNASGDRRANDEILAAANAIEMAEFNSDPVPMVSFFGTDAERLFMAAESLGAEMKRPLLRLNLQGLEIPEVFPNLRLAMRDAALNRGLLVIRGIDDLIDSSGIFPDTFGRFFDKWNVSVVLLSKRNFVFAPGDFSPKRLILRVAVKGLTGSQRFGVWKELLKGLPLDDSFDDEHLRTLAGQFTLNSAQIRSAVSSGLGKAVIEDRDLTISDLYEGARVSSMHHLSDLAKKMEARYTLRDLILPEKQTMEIEQLIAMARNRSQVLEDWGVGKKLVSGRGISALFTGVPGTGKTLTAQVIAGELGLDIYRVDLSTIVSKYIGETEKNLERIFTEAQSSNVILFFDEADSLFGRRSEVGSSHDRYANIEVGYLLQRIETYDGIVLMATNLGANLDEAFARRIHFIIDFPFPDEETRLRLWQLLLPENIEKEEDIYLEPFAYAYKIAGGAIRNAVVWAIYEAARNKRPLNREDLLNGVEREYQKMGKVFIPIR